MPTVDRTGSPSERLTRALVTLQDGYTFESRLTVKGQAAATVTGRRIGDASEIEIESSGATVTYRIVPPSAWLQQLDGEWIEAEGTAPTADPLALLLAPIAVESISGDPGTDTLRATYPPSALGLAGTDPVSVTVSIAANGSITARYETTIEGNVGVSETELRPAASQEPIVAPSPIASPAPG